jgi:hypothetical protein
MQHSSVAVDEHEPKLSRTTGDGSPITRKCFDLKPRIVVQHRPNKNGELSVELWLALQ